MEPTRRWMLAICGAALTLVAVTATSALAAPVGEGLVAGLVDQVGGLVNELYDTLV
ncbi:hypothetical protein SMC26_13975 [Actinomadura fulvescens]|uniref:Secreted protein n=1 Tax=Actinomadura fulvescens TaxID=46160 RepID=A0ABN3Q5Q2_9ACTN